MPSAWDTTPVGTAAVAAPAVSAWDATPATVQSAPPAAAPTLRSGQMYDRAMNYSGRDAVGGAIRGTASIGSTLIRPFESADQNQQRRSDVDAGLTSLIGSDPNSMSYRTNKLIAEIAGTSGVGGLIGKAVSAIPGAAAALPSLIPAIESGGMSAGGATGLYGTAVRAAGGAVNGAATAGLVDPANARTGALIGAATPPVVQALGATGQAVGNAAQQKLAEQLQKYQKNQPLNDTIKNSVDAGYVIPPATVNPTMTNRVLESVSGKMATQQLASVKNAEVTDGLVRQSLGLPADAPLSVGTLEKIRDTASLPYKQVASLNPQAAADLEALKQARNDAQGWFNAYNRSASPADLAKAREAQALSTQLETSLENAAQTANHPELIPALRDARVQIAKTYTVQRALNPATGQVDTRVLARMFQKGKPLSDGLDTVGQFASAFPTVSRPPTSFGSPDAHNLKSIASLTAAVGGGASMGPMGALAGVVPFVAPPAARSIMFSGPVQRGLVQQTPQASKAAQLAILLQNQAALENAGRFAPVTGAALTGP